MRPVEKSYRVHIQGVEYWGLDVFPDGTIQIYQELNPRDIFWTDLTVKEVLAGREKAEIRKRLGDANYAEILTYLAARPPR